MYLFFVFPTYLQFNRMKPSHFPHTLVFIEQTRAWMLIPITYSRFHALMTVVLEKWRQNVGLENLVPTKFLLLFYFIFILYVCRMLYFPQAKAKIFFYICIRCLAWQFSLLLLRLHKYISCVFLSLLMAEA